MKNELFDNELDQVVGGTVMLSKDYMLVGFSTTKETYRLTNCTYRDARNLVDDLLEENPNMNNASFDQFCKQQLDARGWLGAL